MVESKMIVPDQNSSDSKKQQVASMFNRIAPKYDFLNHALSLNIDKIWRRKVIRIIANQHPDRILDVATGTADLAIAASKKTSAKVNGIDISEEMLRFGEQKIEKLGKKQQIQLQKADAENIPFDDNTFDAGMVAFGVRNFENLEAGLAEMCRVIKPGGICVVLEFTMPRHFPVKQLYLLYFRLILPLIGRLISKDKSAYTYLPESVKAFPQREQFTLLMQNAGMQNTRYRNLSLGIAAIYTGIKAK